MNLQPASSLRLVSFLMFSVGIMIAISGGARLPAKQQLKAELAFYKQKAKELKALPALKKKAEEAASKIALFKSSMKELPKKMQSVHRQKAQIPVAIADLEARQSRIRAQAAKFEATNAMFRREITQKKKAMMKYLRMQLRILASSTRSPNIKIVKKPTSQPKKTAPQPEDVSLEKMKTLLERQQLDKKLDSLKKRFVILAHISSVQMRISDIRGRIARNERAISRAHIRILKLSQKIAEKRREQEKLPGALRALVLEKQKQPEALRLLVVKAKKAKRTYEKTKKQLEAVTATVKSADPAKAFALQVRLHQEKLAAITPKKDKHGKIIPAKMGATHKMPSIWPDSWPFFLGGVLLSILGLILWHSSVRKEVAEMVKNQSNDESNPFALLARVQEPLKKLGEEVISLSHADICERVDEILGEYILPFAEVRRLVIEQLGMNNGAEVLVIVSYGERMLNRTWSAASDGHHPEARAALADAVDAFVEANETAQKHLKTST